MTAQAQLTRIIQLVAELTRRERAGEDSPAIASLADTLGVSTDQVTADLRTLTLLGEHADAEWLLSLSVWQQGDRVGVTSGGPFRRPLVLSPDERLAVQAALALDPEGENLAARFAGLWSGHPAAGDSAPTCRGSAPRELAPPWSGASAAPWKTRCPVSSR